MRRFLLIALIPLLAVMQVVALSQNANAASEFDNRINTTETVSVLSVGSGAGQIQDITYNWDTILREKACTPEILASWNNKSHWSVSLDKSPTTATTVMINWTENGETPPTSVFNMPWSPYQATLYLTDGTMHGMYLQYYNGQWVANCGNDYATRTISSHLIAPYEHMNTDATHLFLSTFPHTTPTGYEGTPPPTGVVENDKLRPEFTYTKLGYKLTANYEDNLPYEAKNGIRLTWLLSQRDENGDYDQIDVKHLKFGEQYNYTVTEYDNYILTLGFSVASPFIPPDFETEITAQGILIDGYNETLSTRDSECIDGLCQEVSKYEECEVADLGCHLRNFQTGFWLGFLKFIGLDKTDTSDGISAFEDFNNDTHGLTTVITSPLAIFTNLSQSNYTCNTITLPLPHVGGNINLPCLTPFYNNSAPQLFAIYQIIIGGLVAYYVCLKTLEMAKGIKDPENDKIEATKL